MVETAVLRRKRRLKAGSGSGPQPVFVTPIPYQKIILGNTPSYDLTQHFVYADTYALAPGSPALPTGMTLVAGVLGGTPSAAMMDVYPVIRASNSVSGLYVDTDTSGVNALRISVAQDPGPAPAPTLSQVSSTIMRFTRGALPTNIPAVQCDLLEGPNTPLNASNGTSRLGVLTGSTTYDLTLPTGATRRAKMRYRVNWGDGTSFPSSYTASTESSALTLTPGTSAPSILVADLSARGFTVANLSYALQSGVLPNGDAFGGSMSEVVAQGTSFFTDADREAIATYLLDPDGTGLVPAPGPLPTDTPMAVMDHSNMDMSNEN